MLRMILSDVEQSELAYRLHDRKITIDEHTRLRMVELSARGVSPPKIAQIVARHENTVRQFLKRFAAERFAALPSRKPPGLAPRILESHWQALEAELDASDQAYTSRQMAAWMQEHLGIATHPLHIARVLRGRGWRYNQMQRSVAHKQPAPEVMAAARLELAALKKAGAGWQR